MAIPVGGKIAFGRRWLLGTLLVGCPGLGTVAGAATYSSAILFPIGVSGGYATPSISGFSEAVAGGVVVGSETATATTNAGDHAFVWLASANAGTNPGANPGVDLATGLGAGVAKSYAVGTDGNQQVGYCEGAGPYTDQALLWSNSAGSMVNLNPTALPGISASEAFGVSSSGGSSSGASGGQQVGYGEGAGTSFNAHAMLWTGSANSAVDLNPTSLGITTSTAFGTDGSQQVGDGTNAAGNQNAMLWSSTAASAVNLNPANMSLSFAYGIDGNQQVGAGAPQAGSFHALLWTGTANSAVDLNPSGFNSSQADGTNGSQQVGQGLTNSQIHALLWSGTAASAVDLQTLLPATGTWNSSYADAIDHAGNIFGVATQMLNGVAENFAVEWSPIGTSNRTDIGSGYLDLPNASLADQTAQVRLGYNNGTWSNTIGIMSSAAAADTSHLTAIGIMQNNQGGSPVYSSSNPFEGQSPASTDILIKFTYYGDTNLDGKIDGSDYSRIDNGYLSNNTLTGWFNGDFNYDGVIDGSDYTLIDNAFNEQGAQITAAVSTAEPATNKAIPEPKMLSILTLASLLRTRRRAGKYR
jgi:hypothetical protein